MERVSGRGMILASGRGHKVNRHIPDRVLKLETASPGHLTLLPSHARKLSKAQIKRVAKSIERLGFLDPLLIDESGHIVCGACRWMAAIELGLTAIPVLRAEGLTEAEKRGYRIAENRLAEIGGWGNELLLVELEFLMDDGFDVLDIGFETADLDALFADSNAPEEDDVAEPVPGVPVVSELGDLWRIGDQLLLCGDARNPVCYERLLGSEKAQMVFCDAPYNVKIGGNVSGLGKKVHGEFAMASGEMAEPEFTAFLREVFVQLVRFSDPASIHYQCMDWRHMVEIRAAADGSYTELKNLAVWAKTNAGMSTFYRSQHELIFVFKSGEGTHVNNFGLGAKGRHRSNLWTYAGANVFSATRDKDLAAHPTVKPIAMVADAIKDCSDRNCIVLDPFSGSATTLAAAHRTGRRGVAIELDPVYVDVGIRRLEKETGKVAILETGETFAEVAALRAMPKAEAA